MNANAEAIAHIRAAIEASEAMNAKSTAILISDLRSLLQMAERAVQYEPDLIKERTGFQTSVGFGYKR